MQNRTTDLVGPDLAGRDLAGRDLAGLRILVVEDEWMVAMMIQDALRQWKCEIIGPVPTIDLALAAVQQHTLDGALLDSNLNGRVITPVAEELSARAVPFIMVTGYASSALDVEVVRTAPRIIKPFADKQLAETMMEVFGAGRRGRYYGTAPGPATATNDG